jgi:hypothetical protein
MTLGLARLITFEVLALKEGTSYQYFEDNSNSPFIILPHFSKFACDSLLTNLGRFICFPKQSRSALA